MNAKDVDKILFVCRGNSCRSVMAGGLLPGLLPPDLKERLEIQSAGTGAFPGSCPFPETIRVMREVGIDVRSHPARLLTVSLVEESDMIIVMGKGHRNRVLELSPSAGERVFLLSQFGGKGDEEIEDPLGRSTEAYRSCREVIRGHLLKLVEVLAERTGEEE